MRKRLLSEIPYLRGSRLTLHSLSPKDADALQELTDSLAVYRYLATFLFEKKYPDVRTVIDRLCDEYWKEPVILGVFLGDEFCVPAVTFKDEEGGVSTSIVGTHIHFVKQ